VDVVERYQIMLQKDPRSQVFAPLAEAYRKIGLIEEAFRICVRGVQFHPNFAGGRLALAKVLMDRQNPQGALKELEKVVELSPENILAHQLLGELHLSMKNAKAALRSYKMVLFLAPTNDRALRAVKKLEALTADEFDEDIFSMKPLKQAVEEKRSAQRQPSDPLEIAPMNAGQPNSERFGDLDRYLSLSDAYFVRNDFEKAIATLREAERYYSDSPELQKRLKLLRDRAFTATRTDPTPKAPEAEPPPPSRESVQIDTKIDLLNELLQRIQSRAQR
jgi:tetratricopeptide (TPR) repeat protein